MQDGHVRVDIIYQKLSFKARAWVNLLGVLLLLIPGCLLIIMTSWSFVYKSWSISEGSPDPGGIPLMRIPGLGGKVISKAGGTVVLLPGGEIFTSLERGVIDATEWVGPLHDLPMEFYQATKFYYYPGWHEPGTYLEYFFNKQAYESLPKDLQHIVDGACMENEVWILTQFDAQNGAALQTLINQHQVQMIECPEAVLSALRKLAEKVLEEEAAKSPMAKKVNKSFKKFQKIVSSWAVSRNRPITTVLCPKPRHGTVPPHRQSHQPHGWCDSYVCFSCRCRMTFCIAMLLGDSVVLEN